MKEEIEEENEKAGGWKRIKPGSRKTIEKKKEREKKGKRERGELCKMLKNNQQVEEIKPNSKYEP